MFGKEHKVQFIRENKKENFGPKTLLKKRIKAMLKPKKYFSPNRNSIKMNSKKLTKPEKIESHFIKGILKFIKRKLIKRSRNTGKRQRTI